MPVVHQDHPCLPGRHQVVHQLVYQLVLQVVLWVVLQAALQVALQVHLQLHRLQVVPQVLWDLRDLHRVHLHQVFQCRLQVHQVHQDLLAHQVI